MKCQKCRAHMTVLRSESSEKCVQIWYQCDACGSHHLSSIPSNLLGINEANSLELHTISTKRQNHANGTPLN